MTTVKILLSLSLLSSAVRLASAEDEVPVTQQAPAAEPAPTPAPAVAAAQPAPVVETPRVVEQTNLAKPESHLLHGFRIGGMMIGGFDRQTRTNDDGTMTSLKEEFGLKSKYMMLLGYEGMYRVTSRSWLNVILVGNITVAGLEQSKFIPAVSGLIGAEFDRNFQLGIGVNLTPDEQAPSHMIVAAGWTPKVGTIYTPVHFFVVPDPVTDNWRVGSTVGVSW